MGIETALTAAGQEYQANEIYQQWLAKAYAWLKTIDVAAALHWGNITTGGFLLGSNAISGVHRFGNADNKVVAALTVGTSILNTVANVGKVGPETAHIINAITDELKDPNIEGIPIHAEAESSSKDVEVNEQIVIVNSSNSKNIVVDNATPKLRKWSIRGYLTSTRAGLDPWLVLKPSLKVQERMLRAYADSRLPVWFKSHDGEFSKVLITHIDTSYDPKALNALLINIQLTEFKVMEIAATTAAAIQLASKLGA